MKINPLREVRMDARFWTDHLFSNCFAILAAITASFTLTAFLIARTEGIGWAGTAGVILMSASMPALGVMHLISARRVLRLRNFLPWMGKEAEQGKRMSLPPTTMWVWMPASLGMALLLTVPEDLITGWRVTVLDAVVISSATAGTACWLITTRAALADIMGRWRERRAEDGRREGSGLQDPGDEGPPGPHPQGAGPPGQGPG